MRPVHGMRPRDPIGNPAPIALPKPRTLVALPIVVPGPRLRWIPIRALPVPVVGCRIATPGSPLVARGVLALAAWCGPLKPRPVTPPGRVRPPVVLRTLTHARNGRPSVVKPPPSAADP